MPKNCLNYPVEFVEDLFGANETLAQLVGDRKILLVADLNVVQHNPDLGTRIGAYVKTHGLTLAGQPVVMSGGERLKMDQFQSAMRIITAAEDVALKSEDFILALGGGALLDVASWVAAQVSGGVRLIRVPTTPASMMGAAFAERGSLNLPTVKDALQVVSEPAAVLIDVALATTVLDGVWRGGLSEVVRLVAEKETKSLPRIEEVVEAYASRDLASLSDLVKLAAQVRQKKGHAALGLAVAADLEVRSNWKLPHGYAVAIGTIIDLHHQVQEGLVKEKVLGQVHDILKRAGALDGVRHSPHILPPELADFW